MDYRELVQIAKEEVDDYYKHNPKEPVEMTTKDLVLILLGVTVGSVVGFYIEERQVKKRLKRLEREAGIDE